MTRSLRGKKLLVATHNAGKLEEIGVLLEPFGVECVSCKQLGLPIPEETEVTFAGNALIKAHAGARAAGIPALADDSGLSVDALDGSPGVFSADWAETPQGRDFDVAMKRVWQELDKAGAAEPRRATFHSVLALAWPDGQDATFAGSVQGRIVWPGRGAHGFGYDPIFLPDGFDQTFGEMDRWEKNRISHRARAFALFVAECFT